jgi:hypothetical protein
VLARNQATGVGKSEGLSQGWAILGGSILLALAIYTGVFKGAAPAYVPAPMGTTLPTSPPETGRR